MSASEALNFFEENIFEEVERLSDKTLIFSTFKLKTD